MAPEPVADARRTKGRAARESGYDAEGAAANYLMGQGVQIIARNFRSKGGELDLVALDDDTLAFVEVRLRSHGCFGGAEESITPAKQRKIIRTAQLFLAKNPAHANKPCRFDCVLMNAPGNFQWVRDAFRLD